MKKLLRVAVLSVATGVLLATGPLTARAAAPPPAANGYRVSPVRTDLLIQPGSNTVLTVYLQNTSSAVENVQAIVNDFGPPPDETGNPALLLNGATAPQHSLKRFATVTDPTFTLQPNQQKAVNVALSVPSGTAGGGYYGAIRFAPLGAAGNKNVNLSASVASLVLITVPGNLVEQLSVAGFGVAQGSSNQPRGLFFSNKHLQAIVRFQNIGNVQEQPFGKLQLKQGSTTLETLAVNDNTPPGNVLPDSIRLFSVKLSKVGWFGKYKVEGNFGYGTKGQLLAPQATFYVIPVLVITLAVIALLLILFIIFGLPRLIRAYNRRVIERANKRKP